MNAPLYAVFIADPDRFLTKNESLYIETCERLCKEFGGTFIRVKSNDVATAIADVARKYHITQIVIGESQHSRWKILLRGSLTQKLVRLLKNVDLHIMATERDAVPALSGSRRMTRVIGLISGTSVDGIDAVLVDIVGTDLDLKVELITGKLIPT